MGTIGARKARKILQNVIRVLAIELMCAAQAVEFTDPTGLASATRAVYDAIREQIPPLRKDRVLAPEIELVADLIRSGRILRAAEEVAGPLK